MHFGLRWMKAETALRRPVEDGETIPGSIETGHKCVFRVVYPPDMTMFAVGGYDEPSTPVSCSIV
jgi:hypothetical protein